MTTINYNGQELECITEGYWPEGVTLVWSDANGNAVGTYSEVVCLVDGRALGVGHQSAIWDLWAILPPKPAPRRLTNREIHKLWRSGWDIKNILGLILTPEYHEDVEDSICTGQIKLRAPGSDEWVEPTSDLLEEQYSVKNIHRQTKNT